MAVDWDTSGIHERRVDERMAPEPRRGVLGGWSRGRRRAAGALTGLVSVAIIAAYIWSGNDGADPEAYDEPPLIQAEEGPVRVAPDEPGGMEIPHRDKLVLQRVPGAEEDPRRERLLPPPEEPLPPPREEPVAAYEPPPESQPPVPAPRESLGAGAAPAGPRPSAVAPSGGDQAPRPAVPTAQKPMVKSEPPPPARTQAPPAPAQAAAQAKPAEGPRPLIPQTQQTLRQPPPQQPAPPRASGSTGSGTAAGSGTYVWPSDVGEGASRSAPPRPEAAKTGETKTAYALPPAAAPSGSGAFLVQLAAVSTPEQAQAAWSRLRGNNGDLLAGLSPSYARTDLGSKGVVYRLRAGPVQGETRARALCAQLSGRNVDCMVVRAGG